MKEIKAVVLNFLYDREQWELAANRHVLGKIHQEIKVKRGYGEMRKLHCSMHAALNQAVVVHSSFSPNKAVETKLSDLARYKIASLDLSDELWNCGFFVIVPPWDPSLEMALLYAIEDKLTSENIIPVAVGVPQYVISPDTRQSRILVEGFQLRRNYLICVDGKLIAKPNYLAAMAQMPAG